MPDHEQRLRDAQEALKRAASEHEDATLRRNRAIRKAVADGWDYPRVARCIGISTQRIQQIVKPPE